jgi:hypothetical protein
MMKTRLKTMAGLTAAALAVSTAGTLPSYAAGKPQIETKAESAVQATEFSARKRYYRGNNNAAAAAAFAAIIGGVATYAAAREYRKARERERAYYAPYGYGHRPYYGGYRHW